VGVGYISKAADGSVVYLEQQVVRRRRRLVTRALRKYPRETTPESIRASLDTNVRRAPGEFLDLTEIAPVQRDLAGTLPSSRAHHGTPESPLQLDPVPVDPSGRRDQPSEVSHQTDAAARGNVSLIFRGGAYKDLPGGPNIQRHHMPADSVTQISWGRGPAIEMETADHALTSSQGSKAAAGVRYRNEIRHLIENEQMRKAMAIEIWDVRRASVKGGGRATKYNRAIGEMLTYAHREGWIAK
jgi:hypothetical protein